MQRFESLLTVKKEALFGIGIYTDKAMWDRGCRKEENWVC